MSSSRADAIKHFGSARAYKRMTISQALDAAPGAVRAALDSADLQWIRRFADVPAREAAARLAVRSRGNPDGVLTPPESLIAAGGLRIRHTSEGVVCVASSAGWELELKAQPVEVDASDDALSSEQPREATLRDPRGTVVFGRMAFVGGTHGEYLQWAASSGYQVTDAEAFSAGVRRLVEAAERALLDKAVASNGVRRVILRLREDVLSSLNRCSEPWGLSARVTEVVRQHGEMVKRATPELTLNEWCAICDALNGWAMHDDLYEPTSAWINIADAIEDGLGAKWGLDALALAHHIRDLPFAGAVAVCEVSRRFWQSPNLKKLTNEALLVEAGARIKA